MFHHFNFRQKSKQHNNDTMTTNTVASSSDVSQREISPEQEDLIHDSSHDSASNDGERLLLDNYSEGDETSEQEVISGQANNEIQPHNLVNMRHSANESEIDSEKGYLDSSGALKSR